MRLEYQAMTSTQHTASVSNSRNFRVLSLCFACVLSLCFSPASEAQIYKYRLPNGKLLFTDKPVYETGYTLLNAADIEKTPPSNQNRAFSPSAFQKFIREAAEKYEVEEALIKAIIKAESDFNPDALSRAGAQGLMQLMPKTAHSYQVHDSYNSKQNIDAGTRHIKYLLEKYKNDLTLALAAYNAGETAVNKYGGIPPFPETQRYVEKVFAFKREFESP